MKKMYLVILLQLMQLVHPPMHLKAQNPPFSGPLGYTEQDADFTGGCPFPQNGYARTSQTVWTCTFNGYIGGSPQFTWKKTVGGPGGGTVTGFTSGNLSPIFTTSVATGTTTPALSFTLSSIAAGAYLGNSTSSSALPTYNIPPFGYLDPKAYGAKCDGSTDDTVSFQTAINAVGSSGGAVKVPVSVNGCLILGYDAAITSIASASNVVTVTMSATPSGLVINGLVTITGVTDTSFNGTYQITGATGTTITYSLTGSDRSSSGGFAAIGLWNTTSHFALFCDAGTGRAVLGACSIRTKGPGFHGYLFASTAADGPRMANLTFNDFVTGGTHINMGGIDLVGSIGASLDGVNITAFTCDNNASEVGCGSALTLDGGTGFAQSNNIYMPNFFNNKYGLTIRNKASDNNFFGGDIVCSASGSTGIISGSIGMDFGRAFSVAFPSTTSTGGENNVYGTNVENCIYALALYNQQIGHYTFKAEQAPANTGQVANTIGIVLQNSKQNELNVTTTSYASGIFVDTNSTGNQIHHFSQNACNGASGGNCTATTTGLGDLTAFNTADNHFEAGALNFNNYFEAFGPNSNSTFTGTKIKAINGATASDIAIYNSNKSLANYAGTTCPGGQAMTALSATGGSTCAAFGGGTITGSGTTNLMTKWASSSAVGNSSMTDDGTHPVADPNGLGESTAGGITIDKVNDTGTGTGANLFACKSATLGSIVTCPTSTTTGVQGVAVPGVGTTPGTSGSTSICVVGNCSVKTDNTTVIGHYGIPSTTVAGEIHDTGATTPTAGTDNFLITSVGTTGNPVNVELSTPDWFAQQNTAKVYTVQVNGTSLTAGDTINHSNTTPAAGTNGYNVNFQTSKSGTTDSLSAEIVGDGNSGHFLNGTGVFTAPSVGGVTSWTGTDGNVYTNSASTGAVSATLATQSVNTIFSGPIYTGGSGSTFVQSCHSAPSAANPSCTLPSNVAAGDTLVAIYSNAISSTEPTWSDTLGQTFTHAQASAVFSYAYKLSSSGGADTITATQGNANGVLEVREYSPALTSLDAAGTEVTNNCSGGGNSCTATASVTTTASGDLLIGNVHGRAGGTLNSITLTNTWTNPDTVIGSDNVEGSGAGDYGAGATGTYNFGGTANGSTSTNNAYAFILAFKTSAASAQKPSFKSPSAAFLPVSSGCTNVPYPTIYCNTKVTQTALVSDTVMDVPVQSGMYRFSGTINCTTISAAAVAQLNLKYTDTASTVQTVSISDTCTSLVTTGVPNEVVSLRAKAGTNITWGVAITNTPTYDVDVRLEKLF